jgi:hypothetical protein
MQLPDGFELATDSNDPVFGELVGEARAFAAEAGMDQKSFSKMLAMHAKYEAKQFQMLKDASREQMRALGANGTARIDAMAKKLAGAIGVEHAKSLLGVTFTARQVEALEKLVALGKPKYGAPGAHGGLGSGRNDVSDIPVGGSMSKLWGMASEAMAANKRRR